METGKARTAGRAPRNFWPTSPAASTWKTTVRRRRRPGFSLTKEDGLEILAARGCGRLPVAICPADLGKVPQVLAPTRGTLGGHVQTSKMAHPHGILVTWNRGLGDVPSGDARRLHPSQRAQDREQAPEPDRDAQVGETSHERGSRLQPSARPQPLEERSDAFDKLVELHNGEPRKFSAIYVQDAQEELTVQW